MILSKKRETDHSQGEQTCGCLQGVGREWDGRRVWVGLVGANCYIWIGWAMGSYHTAQGTVFD